HVMLIQQAYSLTDQKKEEAEAAIQLPATLTPTSVAQYVQLLAKVREPFEQQERVLFAEFSKAIENNPCEYWFPRRRHYELIVQAVGEASCRPKAASVTA